MVGEENGWGWWVRLAGEDGGGDRGAGCWVVGYLVDTEEATAHELDDITVLQTARTGLRGWGRWGWRGIVGRGRDVAGMWRERGGCVMGMRYDERRAPTLAPTQPLHNPNLTYLAKGGHFSEGLVNGFEEVLKVVVRIELRLRDKVTIPTEWWVGGSVGRWGCFGPAELFGTGLC